MKTLNLTQHYATQAQIDAGVVEPTDKAKVIRLLTFSGHVPSRDEIDWVVSELVNLAIGECIDRIMIGGAPFLMRRLDERIEMMGFTPVYAFSERVSVETVKDDGTVVKTAEFNHLGFVNEPEPLIVLTADDRCGNCGAFLYPDENGRCWECGQ